ncbi:MAG: type II toxin-antitoxin system RelE/ParE family toxin [Piscinibacter sp.]|nr:type II toxin-antitoxin system RelE/ParE family toxin [Piscinibacter sp.]
MPYFVGFAPEASDQLVELFTYVAERRSPAVAERYTGAVIGTCQGLALFPLRDDIRRPGLRVTHHKGSTLIAYAVDECTRTVLVLGIFYGDQDYEGALSAD